MRSFIIEQLLVIKKTAKETSSVGSSQSELNRLQDEITYLREECNTKNCIIQTLLENQKVIQNTVNTWRFDKNTKIHTEPSKLLFKNSGNFLAANNILSTEIHNTIKGNKTNNANTSNKDREKCPQK